jgi:hypothetical protein
MAHYYTIVDPRPIEFLHGMSGPITTPTVLNEMDVLKLVRRGYTVYEHNPFKKSEKVRVNVHNFNKIVFKTSRAEAYRQRRLNREMQEIARGDRVKTVKKEETKAKEVKKEEVKKEVKEEKPVVTDFQKVN